MLVEYSRCFLPWEKGRIDRLVALECAGGVSAESDSDELSMQSKHLGEMRCHEI